jgi:hypothetical protein
MHPEIMHANAINRRDNTKVLDFINCPFIMNIGTFSLKFMQKLCKMMGEIIKRKDINMLDRMNTSPNQEFATIFGNFNAVFWQFLPVSFIVSNSIIGKKPLTRCRRF